MTSKTYNLMNLNSTLKTGGMSDQAQLLRDSKGIIQSIQTSWLTKKSLISSGTL